jgi:ubiquinone/menaquinone biosynthesis C-methylase UbiE
MTGVRIGERLLYIGSGTPGMFGALAAKVGLSGHAAGIADSPAGAEALEHGGAEAGALVDVQVAPALALPFDPESFDLLVVDATASGVDGVAGWLGDAFRVLRQGGRLVVAERTGGIRLWGIMQVGARGGSDAAVKAVEQRGFRPVRKIAERDGWRFTEGLKPRT